MEVPKDPADGGWFSRGPALGARGPAVIAGHVTWNGALAVFPRLRTMRRDAQVTFIRRDGKTAVFRVSQVGRFSKSRFPSWAVYGPIDHAGLRLVTCGGIYGTQLPGQRRGVRQAKGGARARVSDNQARSVDHHHKRFGRQAGVGVEQAKPVTTRLPKLHMGGEPAGLVGLGGYREVQPLASLPALHPQKSIWATAVHTFDPNGLEGPGTDGKIIQLNGRRLSPDTGRFI
jgi:hypothetical protein